MSVLRTGHTFYSSTNRIFCRAPLKLKNCLDKMCLNVRRKETLAKLVGHDLEEGEGGDVLLGEQVGRHRGDLAHIPLATVILV